MKRVLIPVCILAMMLIVSGCSSAATSSSPSYSSYPAGTSAPSANREQGAAPAAASGGETNYKSGTQTDTATGDAPMPRKVIRDADGMLYSDNPSASAAAIVAWASDAGGFMVSQYSSGFDKTDSVTLSVRVPADRLDDALAYIRTLGAVRSLNITSEDITEAYYDMEARLAQARVRESQYTEFMKRATTIEDVLLVQQQLDQVQADIESMEAKLRLWSRSTDTSLISLNIQPTPSMLVNANQDDTARYMTLAEFADNIKNAFTTSWRVVVTIAQWAMIVVAALIIPAVLVGIVVVVVLLLVSRRRKKKAKPKNPGPIVPGRS